MSNFTEVPYIEKVLSELSGENKAKLLKFVNGVAADNSTLTYALKSVSQLNSLTAGVHAVVVTVNNIAWEGYFVKTTNYKVFITFKNGIDLKEAEIFDTTNVRLDSKGFITSDYLRSLLREDSYISPTELPEAGTKVEANPELAGTEGALTGIKIGDTKFAIPQGTSVEANPTLAGTESALTGLQVGDTKYSIPGGTKWYKHIISIGTTYKCTLISTVSRALQVTNYDDARFGISLTEEEAENTIIKNVYDGSNRVLGRLRQTFPGSYRPQYLTFSSQALTYEAAFDYTDAENFTDTVTEL